jgi:hypothetical protein
MESEAETVSFRSAGVDQMEESSSKFGSGDARPNERLFFKHYAQQLTADIATFFPLCQTPTKTS